MKKNRRLLYILYILMMMLGANTVCQASRQPAFYFQWKALPTARLLSMGDRFANNVLASDSALACYTIVANRYKDDTTVEGRKNSARAYIGKWNVYFYSVFDYARSYECLSKAEELVKGFPEETSRVFLYFGMMYQTMAEQGKDRATMQKALSYYEKCFALSVKLSGDGVDKAFANIVLVSAELGEMKRLAPLYQQYEQLARIGKVSPLRRYVLLLYEGDSHLAAHRYAQAEDCFRRQETLLPASPYQQICLVVAKINRAKAQKLRGNLVEAEQKLMEALRLASKARMKDAQLEIYDYLATFQADRGDVSGATHFRNLYFALKDTLLNYRQLKSIGELRLVSSMKRADEQLEQSEHRRQQQLVAFGVIAGVAVLILCFLLVVWQKNKRLLSQNKSLYEKTLATLRSEEQERKRRETLERELAKAKENIPPTREKYAYNNLGEDEKVLLADRILRVMETRDDIYSPDFSVERLAELVGSRYKLVSQVINETYQVNFSTFLNEYRIKEACRRMSDKAHYGHLSIEAISQAIGFKSRTSFVNAFKKFTGLTPSQFLKMSNASD